MVLEACDATGNCIAERATVTVIASAAPAPAPSGASASARRGGQTCGDLCAGTELAERAACARLNGLEKELAQVEAQLPTLTSVYNYATKATPREMCTDDVEGIYRTGDCAEWRRVTAEIGRAVDAIRALAVARPQVPTDTGLPVIRLTHSPREVETADEVFRVAGLVGDDGSPPRLKVNGNPAPLFRPKEADPQLGAHTLAFEVEVPVMGRPGEQRVVLEACDAAGNCVAERALVAVIASAEPTQSAVQTQTADTDLPAIRLRAPAQIETADEVFHVTDLVGDDGSPPRLKINGEAAPLFRPDPADPALGAHTFAFEVEVPVMGRPGEQRVVIEACDAAGNCITERAFVTVVASAEPEPAPATPEVDLNALVAKLKEENLLGTSQDTDLPRLEASAPEELALGDAGQITGFIGDDGSPPRLRINGMPVTLFPVRAGDAPIAEHTLAFRIDIPTDNTGTASFILEACDAAGNCVGHELAVRIFEPDRPSIRGRNFALVIGNNEYAFLPNLRTAVNDATEVAAVLRTHYAFEEEAVTLLINAGRREILGAMASLRRKLGTDDRLLVYYAGHGQVDPVTGEGFWQPADAQPDEDFGWIANDDIKRYLRGMSARHVLVVADSCFSGTLTRSTPDYSRINEDRFFTEIDSHFSRKVITSGGTEPVADSGSSNHSVFAHYFLKTLRENDSPSITSFELFNGLVRAVTNNSNQKPEYGIISEAGDEGSGDFTFILQTKPRG